MKLTKMNFLTRLSVARRIYLLILIPLIVVFIIGVFAVIALNQNRNALGEINNNVAAIDSGNQLIQTLQRDYMLTLHEVNIGTLSWQQSADLVKKARTTINTDLLPKYQQMDANKPSTKTSIDTIHSLLKTMEAGEQLIKSEDRNRLELYLQNDLQTDLKPIQDGIQTAVQNDINVSKQTFADATSKVNSFLFSAIILILVGTLIAAWLGYMVYKSIADSLETLTDTMRQISAGNMDARANLAGQDELTELANNFDNMIEDRIATQARIDQDHQQLNESVFALLEAVSDLSDRNLTVRATVTEDATGPLADAINQLAEDTSDVLREVRDVASSVEAATIDVNQYAQTVNKLAELEQQEARETANQLETILQKLNAIAIVAQQANQIADTTVNTTHTAQQSVTRSVENMSNIRSTVQETGKRLKRLGERSQEISQIIDVINHLSERTTVLALNASMQATAAGEAGRGFSMIAEEIQRLAENSRESTNQISTLVHNIQQEANTTIATMERTIEQVVNGSSLAENAAQQMQATLDATTQLVGSVEKIAESSVEQVEISKTLQTRAERILIATQTTGKELVSLTELTRNMAEYGKKLMQSVNVFKLEG